MKKHVGIITWYNSNNFGSQLQAYALTKVINSLGYKADMYTCSRYPIIKTLVDVLLYRIPLIRDISLFMIPTKKDSFIKRYLSEYYTKAKIPSFKKHKIMICGSDQIWAPNLYNPYYMLDFVPDEIKKISYAASIGLEEIPENLRQYYKVYINRINKISVREDKGKFLLAEHCGINAEVVLDPTLLVEKKEWDKIMNKNRIEKEYVFCYFLNKNHQYKDSVESYANKCGYEIYGISDNAEDCKWMHKMTFEDVGPCEFLGLIDGAKIIFTDSYHGSIFSLLYHKKFALFQRFQSGEKLCQNSRIEMLNKYFNVIPVNVNSDMADIPSLNYSKFEIQLENLRNNSISFLKGALK